MRMNNMLMYASVAFVGMFIEYLTGFLGAIL